MTPKQKANELFEKYFNIIDNSHPLTDIDISAKQCALIVVDELLNANGLHPNDTDYDYNKAELYWQEVKQEIENL